ncbi:MAG TPA: hypothetical protein PKE65_09425, partial [Rhizobiaceae bacterium]|nr:hypothetical protein [Rhizobiaceae bacterium]
MSTKTFIPTGNLTGNAVDFHSWDGANRLASSTRAVLPPFLTTLFTYGPDGARVRKYRAAAGSTPAVDFLYPSADVEIDARYSVSGTRAGDNAKFHSSIAYTRYPHMDIKTVGAAATLKTHVLHRDHLATVRFVTDETGAVVEQTGYAPYGERLNANFATQKGFVGERHDPETGHPYMVMEMLDGENALELLTRVEPLPAAVACRIGIQVLEGLAEAHAHGGVHRDIKPANLFIADKG